MNFVRAVLNFVVGGALLGVLLTTLVAPRVMTWDNTPGMGKALCDCAETTRQTATRLVNAQLMGTGVGAGLGLVAGLVFAAVRRKKAADDPASPAA
ncbi:MAG: hypothetical protein AMXMBFR34_28090 [Myxococcaceae bacterium]